MTVCTNKKRGIIPQSFYLLLFCISLPGYLYGGLVTLDLIAMLSGPRVMLVGDNHEQPNETEVDAFVDIIQSHNAKIDNSPITMLIEQRLDTENTHIYTEHILISLLKRLEQQELKNTMIENIEIRTSSTATATLINPKDDMLWLIEEDSFFQNGTAEPLYVNTLTFEHIYDEFKYHKTYFDTHYKQYTNNAIQRFFTERIQTAYSHFNHLQDLFNTYKKNYAIKMNETILHIISKLSGAPEEPKECYNRRDILMRAILNTFIPLFDLNAFDRIMHHAKLNNTILLVAGFLHTREIKKVLLSLNGTLLTETTQNITGEIQNIISSSHSDTTIESPQL